MVSFLLCVSVPYLPCFLSLCPEFLFRVVELSEVVVPEVNIFESRESLSVHRVYFGEVAVLGLVRRGFSFPLGPSRPGGFPVVCLLEDCKVHVDVLVGYPEVGAGLLPRTVCWVPYGILLGSCVPLCSVVCAVE